MGHEAEIMKSANTAGIGPECLGSSQDILKMQFVDGRRLPSWLSSLEGRGRRARVRSTFRTLFQQCVRLDAFWLDHGELTRAQKNVLVFDDGQPWLLAS